MTQQSDSEDKKLVVRIQSLEVLLKRETNPSRRTPILFSLGTSYYRYARVLRLAGKKPEQYERFLVRAVSRLSEAEAANVLPAERRAEARYFRGVATMDLNKYDESRALLVQAIEMAPKSDFASGVALYLGEELYEQQKFSEAKGYFERYLPVMNGPQKSRALYKLAWIAFNGGDSEKGEKILFEVANTSLGDDDKFRTDVLRDLASMSGLVRTDTELVKISQSKAFKDNLERSRFMADVVAGHRKEGGDLSRAQIYKAWLAYEENPEERTRIRLTQIRQAAGRSLTVELLSLFNGMRSEFDPARDKGVAAEVEKEHEGLISALADVYAQRSAPPKGHSREQTGKSLLEAVRWQLSRFPQSKASATLHSLWLDTCGALNDHNCVIEVAERIDRDPTLLTLKDSADLERIASLEVLHKKDEPKWKKPLVAALTAYYKKPSREDWESVAKRLAQFLVSDKKWKGALTVLTEVDRRRPTEESFFLLQRSRYDAGDDSAVIADVRSKPQSSERTLDIVREAHLRMAKGKVETTDDASFAEYEKHIREFLKMTTDDKRAQSARVHYFARLEQLKKWQKLETELVSLPGRDRVNEPYLAFLRRTVLRLSGKGDLVAIDSVLKAANGLPPDMSRIQILAKLGLEGAPRTTRELARWPRDSREYVIGLSALASPERVPGMVAPAQASASEKRLIYLSLKIRACDEPPALNSQQAKYLASVIPRGLQPKTTSVVEKKLASIRIPTGPAAAKLNQKKLLALLEAVRTVRAQVGADLAKEPLLAQTRILTQATQIEQQTAELILASPVPKQLSDEQKVEYNTGLSEMAKEFTDQSQEFEALRVAVETKLKQDASQNEEPMRKIASVGERAWPQTPVIQEFRIRAEKMSLLGSLVAIDLMRSADNITELERTATRVGLLLSKSQCRSMREYVREELKSLGKETLIDEWAGQERGGS